MITKAKATYQKLPDKFFCMALDIEALKTKAGFEHVFKAKIRNQRDLEGRAKAIKYIPKLLESVNIHQFHSRKISSNGDIDFWNIQGVIDGVCLQVTLRKIGNQAIHLYSWHWKGVSPVILDK